MLLEEREYTPSRNFLELPKAFVAGGNINRGLSEFRLFPGGDGVLNEAVTPGDEIDGKSHSDNECAEEKAVHTEHGLVIAFDYGKEKQQQGEHSG